MEIPQSTGHVTAAEAVFSDVSMKIHRRVDSWDYAGGRRIVDALTSFARKNRDALGEHSFGLQLTQEAGGTAPLSATNIITANRNGSVLIHLDRDLNILKTTSLNCSKDDPADEVVLSEASADAVIAHYEGKSVLRFYANGFTSGRINLEDPASKVGRLARNRFDADQYELAIRDHYRDAVKYFQETDHWHDRPKRTLRSGLGRCKTTEDIFHQSLVRWLERNLDGDVRSKPRHTSSDEPDIHITSFRGKLYLVEVKWLGKNDRKTTHRRDWLEKAIRQLAEYLKKQPTVWRATIVAYDGRDKPSFEALISADDNLDDGCKTLAQCGPETVHARGSCLVLFLESKTASEA
jgi:hypothetical protein